MQKPPFRPAKCAVNTCGAKPGEKILSYNYIFTPVLLFVQNIQTICFADKQMIAGRKI